MLVFNSSKYKKYSDNKLIDLYQSTSKSYYVGILFERYAHLVLGVCLKYFKENESAKDATLQIFEKLLTDLKHHQISYFKSWLYQVTKNHCLMDIRTAKSLKSKKDDYEFLSQYESKDEDLPELNHRELRLELVETAVTQLKKEQRTCIELFYLKQKCYQEVAKITGYSIKKVKSCIQNGKRNLKLILLQNDEFKQSA